MFSFTAITETGERLSHAVGAAFKACLERKKALEKADVNITMNAEETSFTREGTYRHKPSSTTATLANSQSPLSSSASNDRLSPSSTPHSSEPLVIDFCYKIFINLHSLFLAKVRLLQKRNWKLCPYPVLKHLIV